MELEAALDSPATTSWLMDRLQGKTWRFEHQDSSVVLSQLAGAVTGMPKVETTPAQAEFDLTEPSWPDLAKKTWRFEHQDSSAVLDQLASAQTPAAVEAALDTNKMWLTERMKVYGCAPTPCVCPAMQHDCRACGATDAGEDGRPG